MGELGNYIEDEGAFYLAKLIPSLKMLLSLSITHNHISQIGMKLIVNAIRDKTNLIHFDYVQYGVSLNDGILNDLRKHKFIRSCRKLNSVPAASTQTIRGMMCCSRVRRVLSV